MARTEELLNLLRTNSVSRYLYRHASNNYVGSLRTVLNELGFGEDLNWNRLGDTPFYGEETVIAVRQFGRRNNDYTDGATVNPALLLQMVHLSESRSGMELIRRAIDRNQMDVAFVPSDPNNFGTQQLIPILKALGIAFNDVPDGLRKYSREQGLSNLSGTRMTDALGRALLADLRDRFGPGITGEEPTDPGDNNTNPPFTPPDPIEPKPVTELKIVHSDRYVLVSDGDSQVQFQKREPQGVVNFGYHTVTNFVDDNRDQLISAGVIPQGIEVIEAVSRNEGRMDGINTYDRGFVSLGVFQWTLGSGAGEGELPALLKKIKSTYPRTFRQYFQLYGLDVSDDTNTTYGYMTYEDQVIVTEPDKDQFRTPEWAFRFWRAAQEPDVQTIQVKHALARLRNFYWHPKYAAAGYPLNELITSSYGVALLLDNHVNRPAWVGSCVQVALNQLQLPPDPNQWSTRDEGQLLDRYLQVRTTYSENGYAPMTKANERALAMKAGLNSGSLSDQRGSFQVRQAEIRSYGYPPDGSVTAKSVAPPTPGVAPPEDFSQNDYPIIKMDLPRE